MKIFKITIALLLSSCQHLLAQNLPNNTTIATGDGTGYVLPPKDYNAYPNTAPTLYNFVRTYYPIEPMTSIPNFDYTQNLKVNTVTSYLGGLGNPLMSIARNGSDSDIITIFDNRLSDKDIGYLPFATTFHSKFQPDCFTKQRTFYDSRYPTEDSFAYSVTHGFRTQGMPIEKDYEPGKALVGTSRGTTTITDFNETGDGIMNLSYANGTICNQGTYNGGELFVKSVQGIHGQLGVEYTNRSQQLICKKIKEGSSNWLYTYYIYDDMGKLVCIAPPKAINRILSNPTTQCMGAYDDVCFTYTYDERGNVVAKGTPGKTDPELMFYDKFNRLAMIQTPLMKADSKFQFTIYDELSRVVATGLYSGNQTLNYFDSVARGLTQVSGLNNQMLEYWLVNGSKNYTYPTNIISGCELQSINYYDRYDVIPFSYPAYVDTFTYPVGIPAGMPYMLALGKLVASKTLIKTTFNPNGINLLVPSVYYYDEKGQLLQTHTQSIWQGDWDVAATEYNFAGQPVLQILSVHGSSGFNKSYTLVTTRTHYGSKTGRLAHIEQKIDNGPWFAIGSYSYDNLGRIKTKKLGGSAEVQNYTYNIRGQLIGINAAQLYDTLVSPSNNDSMSYWSSICFDTGFDSVRYDGLITGYKWRSSSSPVMAYGYLYDNVSRMKSADYRDISFNGSAHTWNKVNRDFSVSDITFDDHGNLQTMSQRGYDQSLNPGTIDQLAYSYNSGNQLIKVEDQGIPSPLQDFDNGNSGTNNDYQYDADGNLSSDANKDLSLSYNYQDLPLEVLKSPSGSVQNVYSATGTLFRKTIVENNVVEDFVYLGPLVFKNDSLQYILHSEGRARYNADSNSFDYDFFVKDHLGNVRAVKRSEITYDTIGYTAGFEMIAAVQEEAFFDQIGTVRDLSPTMVPGDNYSGWLDGTDPDKRIGAALLLHGMAGDVFNMRGYGYYEDTSTQNYAVHADAEDMMAALLSTLSGGTVPFSGEGMSPTEIVNNLVTTSNYDIYESLRQGVTDPNYPQAYLNILVFDEEMRLRSEYSEVIQLQGAAGSWHELAHPGSFSMPINGFFCTYFSNGSAMQVAIDNIYAIHYKGHLLEEQLYYPHGMLVDLGSQNSPLKNKYLYEGKKLQDELGMQLYDFHARQYDPQIGRFWGIDPADQYPSGYTGKGNDPANMIDPSGMFAFSGFESTTFQMYLSVQKGITDRIMLESINAKQAEEARKFLDECNAPKEGDPYSIDDALSRSQPSWMCRALGWKPVANLSVGATTEKGKIAQFNSDGTYNMGARLLGVLTMLGINSISPSMEALYGPTATEDLTKESEATEEDIASDAARLSGGGAQCKTTIDGVTYDLAAIGGFFDEHAGKVRADQYTTPDGAVISLIGTSDYTLNNQSFKPFAEVAGNLVLGANNVVTVGRNFSTDNNMTSTCVPAREAGTVGLIHMHPGVGLVNYRDGNPFGGFNSLTLVAGPSRADRDQAGYTSQYLHAAVDAYNIYLYNSVKTYVFPR